MLEKLATLPTRLSHRQELRWLHRLHIIQLVGATFVFTMAIVRIGLRTNRIGINPAHPGGGASGWGAGVAVKSIIFVGYQLVTDAGQRFERFGSLKTNMVMNVLEVPFWFALLAITAGNLGTCVTPMCAINGIILGCSLILALLAPPVAYLAIKHFYADKYSELGRPSAGWRGSYDTTPDSQNKPTV